MCTRQEVREEIDEALKKAHEDFWVNPETHYDHHRELGKWLKTIGIVKKSILVSFVVGFVAGLAGIFWLGFAAYLKLKGGLDVS